MRTSHWLPGLALAASSLVPADGLTAQRPHAADGPRLAVILVVDQLPEYLLTRYADLFRGGFRRLLDEGRVYPNATHDHLITETAPGHATISTGTHPSRHGVVSNQWFVQEDGQWRVVENVLAPSTPVTGRPTLGGASPEVLLRDGFADWLVKADDRSRVVSLSGKPRGAVLLAGHHRGEVLWFEPAAGAFVTSTWYRDEVPAWVSAFNEEALPELAADTVWESTVPPSAAARSRPDTSAFEGSLTGSEMPHSITDVRAVWPGVTRWDWMALTPGLDRATLALARRAVEAAELGADDVPDLLAVSLSQTDRVGHEYGPLSREQLDNLLRLDAELGGFLDFLDETVGKGRYVLALTSDHGAEPIPEWEREHGIEGAVRLNRDSLASLQAAVHRAARKAGSSDPEVLAGPLAAEVQRLPWVARAWTRAGLQQGEPADSFELLARRSEYPGRPTGVLGRLGVVYMVAPHVLPFGYPEKGSTHQSGYLWDRRVPLVLMGPAVEPGTDPTRVGAVDVAPTLAMLVGIPVPTDLDGEPGPVGGG